MDNGLFSNDRKGLAPGMQISPFGESYQIIGPASKLFGFNIGRANTFVLEQRRHHISEHGLAVTACSV